MNYVKTTKNVILASQSPRRIEILKSLQIPFDVCVSSVVERWDPRTRAENIVQQLARKKAEACAKKDTLIIAMDTLVVLGRYKLGKPANKQEAIQMLQQLNGKMHRVYTGVALLLGKKAVTDFEVTKVFFRTLKRQEIDWYVNTGEPMDKAGGYAIQGVGSLFIDRIEGSYFNVVGFPIGCFQRSLKRLKIDIYELMG
jgi:septum formation protein